MTALSAAPTRSARHARPTRRLVPRGEREQQMLGVATRLFAERGFQNVSMDEIADEVGITKPMLYAYFDSKEGLYVACIRRAAQPLQTAVSEAVDPALPPERQLWRGLLAFFRFVDEHRELWSTFFVEASARGGAAAEQVTRARQEVVDGLTPLILRAAEESGVAASLTGEIALQGHALMGAAESLAAWWLEHPNEGSSELLALRLMNFAWMGFGDLLDGNFWLPPGDSDSH